MRTQVMWTVKAAMSFGMAVGCALWAGAAAAAGDGWVYSPVSYASPQYTYVPSPWYLDEANLGLGLALVAFALWLAFGVAMVVKGRRIPVPGGWAPNPMRRLGGWLLATPPIVVGLGVASASLRDEVMSWGLAAVVGAIPFALAAYAGTRRVRAWASIGATLLSAALCLPAVVGLVFGDHVRALFATSANALGGQENASLGAGGAMAKRKRVSNFGSGETMGFSVGGAKDVATFRQNVENGFLPQPTDVTYEGLFYDYFFDTGARQACESLFCPSYASAVSKDPFNGEPQHYLTVGLNSNLDQDGFRRKKLNLVVVLDISGSMRAPFHRYHYSAGAKPEAEAQDPGWGNTKIEVAKRSLQALVDHLGDEDRLGVVLFDQQAYLARALEPLEGVDREALKARVLEIQPRGGTNFEAGLELGTEQFAQADLSDRAYENRIVFMTDAMPNAGDTSDSGLLGKTRRNAERRLYTTFVGMGVDFNSALVEAISRVRGANYLAVHSAADFKKRLADEFDLLVTPMIFDLALTLDSEAYEIDAVYGTPEADLASGTLMRVATLFPSQSEGGETRGGVVLLKLRKKANGAGPVRLRVAYVDREGNPGGATETVALDASPEREAYAHTGIHKAIVLARYADLLRHWMRDTRSGGQSLTRVGGLVPAPVERPSGNHWERGSTALTVSAAYASLFADFAVYFGLQQEALGDATLGQEARVLAKLSRFEGPKTASSR